MQVLTATHRTEVEVRKSRFIATAVPIESAKEARRLIELISEKEATHNCWAYRVAEEYRFSDDGEPGGTAGRPILAAIEKQGVDRCLVVVTRFFGGVKLGAGGLARAYGGTAAECLRTAPTTPLVQKAICRLRVPFDLIGEIYPLLKQFEAEKREEQFDVDGVHLSVEVNADRMGAFETTLADATRGRAAFSGGES